jgi:Chaperone for flagella basal body P-ring formation
MSYRHCSLFGYSLRWLSILSMAGLVSAQAVCYNTPIAAAGSMKPGASLPSLTEGGYRVTSIQLDPILGKRWAMIASCDHPERPAFSLLTEESDSSEHILLRDSQTVPDNAQVIPVVHAGDTVRLWRQEAFLRIELAGVAEENGTLGKLIKVRLLRRNTDDQSTRAEFAGVVRGKSDVEMQP